MFVDHLLTACLMLVESHGTECNELETFQSSIGVQPLIADVLKKHYGYPVQPTKLKILIDHHFDTVEIYVARTPHGQTVLTCIPPKNGHSWWLNMFRANSTSFQFFGNMKMEERVRFASSGQVIKWMIVRNPVERVLSAWLTMVGRHKKSEGNWVPSSFSQFVDELERAHGPVQNSHKVGSRLPRQLLFQWGNSHWRPQIDACKIESGLQFDYVLYFEERASWAPKLLDYFGFQGKARQRMETSLNRSGLEDPKWECPGYHCHAETQLLKEYTPALLDRVVKLYQDDIAYFRYEREICKFRDRLLA